MRDLAADLKRLQSSLEGTRDLVVSTHLKPDGDAIGSESALSAWLLEQGKRVRIVNNDPTPELLRFIEPEGVTIELYDPATHDALFRGTDRVLLVDNSAPDRLGRLEPIIREVADNVLCIDHHPAREVPWSDPILDVDACATAAIVYRLTHALGWKPTERAALATYVGIAADTGFFRFNSTNPEAHRIAAELIEQGVDQAAAYRALHERNSVAYTRLLGHALGRLRIDREPEIASVCLTREAIDALDAGDVDTSEIMSALLALDGVRIALLFRELGDGNIKVSLRSKGSIDVHALASEFGGGGHKNASGIVMPAELDDCAETIIDRAKSRLEAVAT